MTPGGTLPTLTTAEKGNLILACALRTEVDTAEARRRDVAAAVSEGNRNMNEALLLAASDPRPPPWDYNESKLTVSTFCALQWALVGEHSSFYQQALAIRRTLYYPQVK